MRARHPGWLLVTAIAIAGCGGGATLPADRLVSAEASLHGASEVGAESVPDAAKLSETRGEQASERIVLADKDQHLTPEQRGLASLEKVADVKKEARGTVITLNGALLFMTSETTLLPSAQDRLREVAHALKETFHGQVVVEGHMDSTGLPAANQQLSQQRAEAVRAFLVSEGVAADRIRAVGLGQSRPVADNATAEGRAHNRRVEIVVSPESVPH